jgi:diphthamide biosynthesis protein 7
MAEEQGKLVRSLKSQTLDLPPSCVEFCPAFPSYFLVGTYSLQPEIAGTSNDPDADAYADADADADEGNGQPSKPKQPQSRNGSIIAFQVVDRAM